MRKTNTGAAFVPAAPLVRSTPRRPAPPRATGCPVLCSANPRRRHQPVRFPPVLVAAAGALLGIFGPSRVSPSQLFQNGGTPSISANAATSTANSTTTSTPPKKLRYDGRQELNANEKAISTTMTMGAFAALSFWAYKQNRRDDELETVRIKEEVERLEKLQAEFVDVEEDDDSLNDEDLLASLKQRISEGEDDETDGSDVEGTSETNDGESDSLNLSATSTSAATASPPPSSGTDDNDDNTTRGTLDPPLPSDISDSDRRDPSNGATSPTDISPQTSDPDSVDMLRRMWEATDDEPKKNKP